MMELAWKSLLGGGLTAFIAWLSKRGDTLPGIVPLFPTFAIIALLIVGAKENADSFRLTSLAGIKTIPAYLAFLIACYFSINYMDYRFALALGLLAWSLVAALTFIGFKAT